MYTYNVYNVQSDQNVFFYKYYGHNIGNVCDPNKILRITLYNSLYAYIIEIVTLGTAMTLLRLFISRGYIVELLFLFVYYLGQLQQ